MHKCILLLQLQISCFAITDRIIVKIKKSRLPLAIKTVFTPLFVTILEEKKIQF
jgi:hypothetical protein